MMSCSLPFGALSIPTEQTACFCSLKLALEVDWTNEKAKSSLKHTPVDYFLLHGTCSFYKAIGYKYLSDKRELDH